MPARWRPWAAGALTAITIAGCGVSAEHRNAARPRAGQLSSVKTPSSLPARWRRLRLSSGAMLPYPAGWRVLTGDPGSASAALLNPDGTVRAYTSTQPLLTLPRR